MQFFAMRPKCAPNSLEAPSLRIILRDPYILVCAGALTISNVGIAVLEPTLPIHMLETMKVDTWQLGVVMVIVSMTIITNER